MAKSSTVWDRTFHSRVTLLNAVPTHHPVGAALLWCVAWALSHVSSSSPGYVGVSLSSTPFGLKCGPLIHIGNTCPVFILHFSISLSCWLNIFVRNYVLLFTSSLLPFNYIFALISQNQDRKFICFIFHVCLFDHSLFHIHLWFPFFLLRKKIAVLSYSY